MIHRTVVASMVVVRGLTRVLAFAFSWNQTWVILYIDSSRVVASGTTCSSYHTTLCSQLLQIHNIVDCKIYLPYVPTVQPPIEHASPFTGKKQYLILSSNIVLLSYDSSFHMSPSIVLPLCEVQPSD